MTDDDGTCSLCPRGKYKSGPGASICLDMTNATCPAGQGFSSASADTDDQTGATDDDGTCSLCPRGKYKSAVDNSMCLIMDVATCEPGESYSSTSSSLYGEGAVLNDGTCLPCAAGKFKATAGTSACLSMTNASCPADRNFRSPSSTQANLTGGTADDGTCELCPSGRHKSSECLVSGQYFKRSNESSLNDPVSDRQATHVSARSSHGWRDTSKWKHKDSTILDQLSTQYAKLTLNSTAHNLSSKDIQPLDCVLNA